MGDLAGCRGALRLKETSGGDDLIIKVERYRYSPEIDSARIRTTDRQGVKQTVITGVYASGRLEIEGYWDPQSDVASLGPLASNGSYNYTFPAFYSLRFFFDAITPSQSGIEFYDDDSEDDLPSAQVSDFEYTGDCTAEGMQRFRLMIDAQFGSAIVYDLDTSDL